MRLVSKTVAGGTSLKAPTNAPLSIDWKQRLRQIRQFSTPRNEIFFAEAVILVEGTTEVGAISVLADIMPNGLDFDRHNCSLIEVNGKENLPMFMKMVHALGKRFLVVYDTDSDKTDPHDIATNERRNKAISDALTEKDDSFACDPYFEQVAGVAGTSKKDKEGRAREHLSSFTGWADVPDALKNLMSKIEALVLTTPEIPCPEEDNF